jgi:hypothetical protein
VVKELFELVPGKFNAVHKRVWSFLQQLETFFESCDILGRYSADVFTIV